MIDLDFTRLNFGERRVPCLIWILSRPRGTRPPPRLTVHEEKSLPRKTDKLDCGTIAPTAATRVCDAKSPSATRHLKIDHDWPARFLNTTLVLDAYPPDFSTEAINSALIAGAKSPPSLVRLQGK